MKIDAKYFVTTSEVAHFVSLFFIVFRSDWNKWKFIGTEFTKQDK